MRGALFGLLGLAACYQPAVPTNVPCSPGGACPGEQMCIAGFCAFESGAVPDAPPGVADRDHDGIADGKDNCPDTANPDQANEDGDKFGEACDPCPQIKDDVGTDSDGDHVGDLCDPNPGVKDRVWLYNGFHAGLPSWSRSVNWAPAADKVRTTADNSNDTSEYLVTPFVPGAAPDNFSVTMTVLVEQALGSKTDHSIGIEIYDMNANVMKGVDCGFDAPAGASSFLFLSDDFITGLDKSAAFSWSFNTEYRVVMTRHGATYTCSVTGPAGTQTLSGTSAVVPRDGNAVDIWAYGTIAQYGSVQIIGAP